MLHRIPLFHACTEKELELVDTLAHEVEIRPGEIVGSEREQSNDSFIIISGEASLVIRDRSVSRLGPGDLFGWLTRLSAYRPRSATVMAITPMQCLVVPTANVGALLDVAAIAKALVRL